MTTPACLLECKAHIERNEWLVFDDEDGMTGKTALLCDGDFARRERCALLSRRSCSHSKTSCGRQADMP